MSDNIPFKLADYTIGDDVEGQDSIPVFITKQPFRIHPDKSRVTRVHLSRFDEKNWWLVKSAVKKAMKVPRYWVADLHHGVLEDGTNFIMPLTHPHHGCEGYYDSLKKAIDKARSAWCKVTTDNDERTYNVGINSKLWAEPSWLDGEWSDFIEVAFQESTIDTLEQAKALFEPFLRRRITEESMD
ncbi:hypothetical protein [Propionivibrio sp.]|uniref:hypothetical protein n=1 Tax=Propionivibrio sp. TaxID=2212460 RepID=UPI003BF11E8B